MWGRHQRYLTKKRADSEDQEETWKERGECSGGVR